LLTDLIFLHIIGTFVGGCLDSHTVKLTIDFYLIISTW